MHFFTLKFRHINFGTYNFKLNTREGKEYIFDIIRKKYILLTPEEWVRQNWVHLLIHEKNYPISLISVEKGLIVNKMPFRFDIVVYNRDGVPSMLVECKAPTVNISQKTFDQAAKYNLQLKVPLLVVSNGLQTFCAEIDFATKSWEFLDDLPSFEKVR